MPHIPNTLAYLTKEHKMNIDELKKMLLHVSVVTFLSRIDFIKNLDLFQQHNKYFAPDVPLAGLF